MDVPGNGPMQTEGKDKAVAALDYNSGDKDVAA